MHKIFAQQFDSLLDKLPTSLRGGAKGYLTAAGLVLVALLVRLAIAPIEAGVPFLTFFPAVTLTALLCGFGPGLLALVVSSALASYLFMPPFASLSLTFHPELVWSNVVFYAEELGVMVVISALFRQHKNHVTTAHQLAKLEATQQELKIAAKAFESQEGTMITDADGVILRVNRAFTEITGYTAEETVGHTARLIQSSRRNADSFITRWGTILRPNAWQGEPKDRRKSDPVTPKWLTISAIKGGDGAVTHYVGTHFDITERKNSENAMLKMYRDLNESRQRLRELAAQNEIMLEDERKHIAREVHDELGQVLTALRMDLSLMHMRFGSLDPALIDKVQDMKNLVDRAIQGVRNVAVNLRPTALDMGLVSAIEWLSNEFNKQTGVECVFQARQERIDLDETRAVVVFRIVQESLTNITRYAAASLVNITLGHRGNELWLEVRDNGRGFDLDAATKGKSFGLLGMRERALALGGQVKITSAPDQGTAIGVTIPISPDATMENNS